MFWDGERWIPDARNTDASKPPAAPKRVRDWLATIPILLLVPALVLPLLVASAAPTRPRVLVSGVAFPGATVTVVGRGFKPSDTLGVRWDGAADGMPAIDVDSKGKL